MSHDIYYVACSVDGFIARSDGDVSRLRPFEQSGEDYGYAAFYDSIGELVMGSRTCEQLPQIVASWPYPGKRTHVVSRRPLKPQDQDVSIVNRRLRDLVEDIRLRSPKDVWVVGGGALAGSFVNEQLLDELIVTYVPVLLGASIPLFRDVKRNPGMDLLACQHYRNGAVHLRCQLSYRDD